jgi:PadR family transcriptional regulator, regulatory protein PadR
MDTLNMIIKLGDLEAKVLYAVVRCGDHAYGVSISDTIKNCTGEDFAMGAIYATLDRLARKKLLRSSWSEPGPDRGGRRKRLFEITGAGKSALRAFDARFDRMRAGLHRYLTGGTYELR